MVSRYDQAYEPGDGGVRVRLPPRAPLLAERAVRCSSARTANPGDAAHAAFSLSPPPRYRFPPQPTTLSNIPHQLCPFPPSTLPAMLSSATGTAGRAKPNKPSLNGRL